MASKKQIAWRKKFAKLYGNKKKKGSKSKPVKTKKSKTKISRKAGVGMGMRAYQNANTEKNRPTGGDW